jgi:peptidase M28-like protein/PDZ domain-containing protein/PA domain-containing protein
MRWFDRIAAALYDFPAEKRVHINFDSTKEQPGLRRSWAHAQVILALFALSLIAADTPTTVGTAEQQRFLADIKTLTRPAMEGRGDGTKGLTRAAHLIEERYESLGLQPAGKNGFFQPFDVITGRRLRSGNRLHEGPHMEEVSIERRNFKLLEDYIPLSFSANGSVDAPLVFAGYGITAPEFSYDEYQGLDTKGKVVLVFRGEPASLSAKSKERDHTPHESVISKAINAKNHGATAIIFLNGKLPSGEEDVLPRFGDAEGPEDAGILCLQVKNSIADAWFRNHGKAFSDVQRELDDSGQSSPLLSSGSVRLSLSVTVNIETIHATVNNVLAYLPGKTDEYVILGAHYDHLGRGQSHSLAPSQIGQIHPGADDNASGTAGVLELARLFAPLKGHLQRGILFANFAGEELGLLGSAEWVKNPTLPLDKAVAMLNMDMIGRIKNNKVYLGGLGTGTTFQSILDQAEANTTFTYENSPGGYSSSDHTSFVTKRIPVLFFFSGLHSDYHKPSDTWEKINADSAAHLLDLVSNVALRLDNAPDRPTFVLVVENPNPHAGTPSGGGYGPYFGSIPDFGQTENGVRFSDVRPGSPAAKAGLQAGDVLIQFGEKPIKNLYDFTDALRRSKVGDTVQVTVLRDGKRVAASVTLEQRR